MKHYTFRNIRTKLLAKVTCNNCGEVFESMPGEYFTYDNLWIAPGEEKDLREDEIDLCNPCYDAWVAQFKILPYEDHE